MAAEAAELPRSSVEDLAFVVSAYEELLDSPAWGDVLSNLFAEHDAIRDRALEGKVSAEAALLCMVGLERVAERPLRELREAREALRRVASDTAEDNLSNPLLSAHPSRLL